MGIRFSKGLTLTIISVALIFIGFGALTPSINEVAPTNLEPISYSKMTSVNVSPGQRIQGDIAMNYGAYMEEYMTVYGIKTSTNYEYYLIDLGNEGYIGVKASHGITSEKFDQQCDETYAYLLGETHTAPSTISFDGVVQKASQQEQRFMKEYLISMGYTAQEAEKYSCRYIIESESSNDMLFKTIGSIMVFVGIILLMVDIILKVVQRNNRIVAKPQKANIYTPYDPATDPSNPFGDSMNGAQYSEQAIKQSSYNSMNDYEDEIDFEKEEEVVDEEEKPKSKFSLRLED